ncbi:MAG: type II toxin-antitoxin system Phd/YefM family antitoxin [Deltaproteobacteria bacterium]|nr:type II toxin-antitoxin system Phd/YefM family antitoxin [Deltaproteobacteria bacterium]
MYETTVNQFRAHLKEEVEKVIKDHEPLRVTRRNGEDFVVVSLEDYQQEQETLLVLQNDSLMKQIGESLKTHSKGKGYQPTQEELDEINRI